MKKLEKKSFNNIMNEIRESMRPSQKVLSKIFHFRPIEIFLDFIDYVLFRSYTLILSILGMILSTITIYIMSIYVGFYPYGSEQFIGIAIGFIIGIIVDFIILRTKNKNIRHTKKRTK